MRSDSVIVVVNTRAHTLKQPFKSNRAHILSSTLFASAAAAAVIAALFLSMFIYISFSFSVYILLCLSLNILTSHVHDQTNRTHGHVCFRNHILLP